MTAFDVMLSGATDVLEAADAITVGVLTKRGPHTTPELFAVAGGRLWCLTAATTLKAKLLAEGGPVAFAATAGARAAVGIGRAIVVDPAHPVRNLRSFGVSLAAPGAVGHFVVRNAAELTGAAFDLLAGRLGGPIPPRRVVLSIEPYAVAAVDGVSIVEERGWTGTADAVDETHPPGNGDTDLLDEVPDGIRELAADGPAAVGWTTASGGPLVLPARWDATRCRAEVPAALFELVGAASRSRASVTRDHWTGFGPTGKQGLMLCGDGVASAGGDATVLTVEVDSVAYWDGIETRHVTDELA